MSSEQQYSECSICTDCVIWFANGDTSGDWTEKERAEFLSRVGQHTRGCEITLGSVDCEHCGSEAREADRDGTEDCEPWFSWSSCDTCGSHLGGNRHHAVAWLPDSPLVQRLRGN